MLSMLSIWGEATQDNWTRAQKQFDLINRDQKLAPFEILPVAGHMHYIVLMFPCYDHILCKEEVYIKCPTKCTKHVSQPSDPKLLRDFLKQSVL